MIVATAPVELTGDHRYRERGQWPIVTACLLIYVVLAVAVFWPVSPWNALRLPTIPFGSFGVSDPVGMTWSLAWVAHALQHGLNVFHTNYLDYPNGAPITNGGPLLGLMGAPVTLTLGPIAAFNVLLRLAFASSAASMFLVLRSWCRWPAAFVGGLIYGFGPYVVSQGQSHLNLMFVPIPPLIVWCVYELLITKRRNAIRVGALLGLLCAAQALIEEELLTLLGLVIAIGLVGLALYSGRAWRQRFDHLARAIIPAFLVFIAITGIMLWSLLFGPGHLTGTISQLSILQAYRTDLLGPIIPTFSQLLMPSSLASTAAHFLAGNPSENSTYLGIPAVVLLGVFAVKFRRQPIVLFSTLLAVVAFILSLGSKLSINGHVTSIPLPETLFTRLPFLDNTVPSRFSFVVCLFSAIALAVGADYFIKTLESRPTTRRFDSVYVALGFASLVLCVACLLPQVPFKTEAPPWPPNINSTLKTIPSGSVVLTYPYPSDIFEEAMSWQASDAMRFHLFGGYVIVQGKQNYGVPYQPLLPHPFVQEYLAYAQYGSPALYPRPSKNVSAPRALCRFISQYGVGAIIFWNEGAHPKVIKQLFVQDFGLPERASRDGNILVWLTSSHSCSG
jgi:hypothetical protein